MALSRHHRGLLLLVMLFAVPPPAARGATVLEDVCKSASSLCSMGVRVPTSASLTYHNEKLPCCTGNCPICTPYVPCNCKVSWKGVTCDQCRSCRDACCPTLCDTKVPDGIKIAYTDYTGCSLAAKLGVKVTALDRLKNMCPCLSQIPSFASAFSADSPTSALLTAAGKLADCMVSAGFGVQNNLAPLRTTGQLASTTDVIIEGPPINNAFYISLVGAVATCATTAKCDDVVNVFLDYFKLAGKTFGDALVSFIKTFYVDRLFNAVLNPVKAVKEAANKFPQSLRTQLASCANAQTVVNEVYAAADAVSNTANDLQTTITSGNTLITTVQNAVTALGSAVAALSASYKDTLIKTVHDIAKGKAPDFADSVKFLLNSQQMKDATAAANTFKSSLAKLQTDLQKLPTLTTNVENAIKKLPTACKVDVSLLNTVKTQLQASQAAIVKAGSIPVDTNTLQAGLGTYNSWIPFSITMPCSKMTSKPFSIGAFKITSLSYPEFYACDWSPSGGKVPLPNSFIPYLRLKNLKGKAPVQLLELSTRSQLASTANITFMDSPPVVPASDATEYQIGTAVGSDLDVAMFAKLQQQLDLWVKGDIKNLTQAYDPVLAMMTASVAAPAPAAG